MNSMKYETLFREIKRKEVTTTAWGLGAQYKKKENQLNEEKIRRKLETCSKDIVKMCNKMSFKV